MTRLDNERLVEMLGGLERCPTCQCNWKFSKPASVHGSNLVRCIECKAIYPDPDTIRSLITELMEHRAGQAGAPVAWQIRCLLTNGNYQWRNAETPKEIELIRENGKDAAGIPYELRPVYTSPLPNPPVFDEAMVERLPDDIRAQGWAVAVHNDYRLDGVPHTFWLFTKDSVAVKGEGKSDAEALNQVRATLTAAIGAKP